jgi:hypothetical protein
LGLFSEDNRIWFFTADERKLTQINYQHNRR